MTPCDNCIENECEVNGYVCPLYEKYQESKEQKMNDELISRSALKKSLNFVYDCDYIGSKSIEGIVSDIIEEIDHAPTVPNRYDDGYAQGYIDGQTGADYDERVRE